MRWILVFVICFLVIGSYIIISSNSIDMQEKDGRKTFIGKAWDWMKHVGGSTKDTVGYAVKQDWLPETEQTNKTAD